MGLITFCSCLSEKEDVVLAVALFTIDAFYQWRQLFKIGWLAIDKDLSTVVPPHYACFTILFSLTFALHE